MPRNRCPVLVPVMVLDTRVPINLAPAQNPVPGARWGYPRLACPKCRAQGRLVILISCGAVACLACGHAERPFDPALERRAARGGADSAWATVYRIAGELG